MMTAQNSALIDLTVRRHRASPDSLIPILQELQDRCGFLAEDALRRVAAALGLPAARVFAVATFYSGFSLVPRGRVRIEVCHGTACHVKGGGRITDRISDALGVLPGTASADSAFSLHAVRCLGCCALAPVVKVNDELHAGVSPHQAASLLEQYR